MSARNRLRQAVLAAVRSGSTYGQVALKLGISRSAVAGLVHREQAAQRQRDAAQNAARINLIRSVHLRMKRRGLIAERGLVEEFAR